MAAERVREARRRAHLKERQAVSRRRQQRPLDPPSTVDASLWGRAPLTSAALRVEKAREDAAKDERDEVRIRSVARSLTESQVRILEKGEHLGRGRYGSTTLVRWHGQAAVLKEATVHSKYVDFKDEFLTLCHLLGEGGAPLPLGLCRSPVAMVMSYVGSCTLAKALKRRTLSEAELLEVAICLCRRVGEIQAKGVVHNDLKEDNIMVDDAQKVYLIDFGLATREDEVVGYNVASGGAQWLAPEIRRKGRSSFASDVYSVGRVLKHVYDAMSSTSDKFSAAIDGATSRASEERPTVRELLALLRDLRDSPDFEPKQFDGLF